MTNFYLSPGAAPFFAPSRGVILREKLTQCTKEEFDNAVAALSAPVLTNVKDSKVAQLTASCEGQITGGIESDALGSAHDYGTRVVDQLNLTAALARAEVTGSALIQCSNIDGRAFAAHTVDGVKKVLADFSAHQTACSEKLAKKVQDVQNCATCEEVQSIEW